MIKPISITCICGKELTLEVNTDKSVPLNRKFASKAVECSCGHRWNLRPDIKESKNKYE